MTARKKAFVKSIKVIRGEGRGGPVIDCDRCGTIMRGRGGNVYLSYSKKSGKTKSHKPFFVCSNCTSQQWQEDQAKEITRSSFELWEFLRLLRYNARTESQKREGTRIFRMP